MTKCALFALWVGIIFIVIPSSVYIISLIAPGINKLWNFICKKTDEVLNSIRLEKFNPLKLFLIPRPIYSTITVAGIIVFLIIFTLKIEVKPCLPGQITVRNATEKAAKVSKANEIVKIIADCGCGK